MTVSWMAPQRQEPLRSTGAVVEAIMVMVAWVVVVVMMVVMVVMMVTQCIYYLCAGV